MSIWSLATSVFSFSAMLKYLSFVGLVFACLTAHQNTGHIAQDKFGSVSYMDSNSQPRRKMVWILIADVLVWMWITGPF